MTRWAVLTRGQLVLALRPYGHVARVRAEVIERCGMCGSRAELRRANVARSARPAQLPGSRLLCSFIVAHMDVLDVRAKARRFYTNTVRRGPSRPITALVLRVRRRSRPASGTRLVVLGIGSSGGGATHRPSCPSAPRALRGR